MSLTSFVATLPILLPTLAALMAGGVVSPAGSGQHWSQPSGDYESRRMDFLEHAAAAPGGLYSQIVRLELGRGPIDDNAIASAIAILRARRDGGDFIANGLLRVLSYRSSPLLSDRLRQDIRAALLGFKYWVDEPGGRDLLSMWSEGHQIAYHAAQYLAGQAFPDEIFSNSGKSGRWHQQRGQERVLKWIDIKARTGFNEWDSNNCYVGTISALLNLSELAQDTKVRRRAAMLLDVMFFDMAVDSFQGTYGTSHGRSYLRAIVAGATEDTSGLQRLAWGMGALGRPDNPASVYLATGKRYRVARTIELIAQDQPDELTNRERQSLRVEDAARLGLRFDDPEDFFLLHEGGKMSSIDHIERSLRVTDGLRFYRYGLVMRPYIVAVLETYREMQRRGLPPEDLDNSSLRRVDKLTFRTPDYQLSSALDYRKGAPGSQQHIWQATLAPGTVVFTMNPGGSSKYWQGRLPRVAQHRNLLVALYDLPAQRPPGPRTLFPPDALGDAVPSPAPSEEPLVARTLAVFRPEAFDEVFQRDGWTFGRKGQGYVALWSRTPTAWSTGDVFGGDGLIAQGLQHVWVCQLGREKVDGPFRAWAQRIAGSPLQSTPTSINYTAPGLGQISFAWTGPFRLDGQDLPLGEHDRFDNPYTRVPHGRSRYDLTHAGHRLLIDFTRDVHRESLLPPARAPEAPPPTASVRRNHALAK
jgi:hypothetical protein